MPETEQRNINPAALPDFHTSSGDNVLFCPLSVRVRSRGFPHMGGCYLLKYNGGDSGIKISVLYRRFSSIRVSVIRGSTVYGFNWTDFWPNSEPLNHMTCRLLYRVSAGSTTKRKKYGQIFIYALTWNMAAPGPISWNSAFCKDYTKFHKTLTNRLFTGRRTDVVYIQSDLFHYFAKNARCIRIYWTCDVS
jgi:hypothetical protein